MPYGRRQKDRQSKKRKVAQLEVIIEAVTKNHYFYITKENISQCPECKREYKARKFCLNCSKKLGKDVPTEKIVKEHTGIVTKDLKRYSCDCIFSSFFGWSKFWKENHPKSNCRHIKWVLKQLKRKGLPNLWK